jgi:L-arabinose isomerase
MANPKIGLLPLYIALYDESLPELRHAFDDFRADIERGFARQGIAVVPAPICCVKSEFATALARFREEAVDCIVTLHLAYSPSLESAELLASMPLPVLMLDVTPDDDFGLDVDPQKLLYNHGIHGVQDLSAMLRRLKKDYWIVAGHLSDPTVMMRAADIVRGAGAAGALAGTHALRIGPSFAGMGDFAVEPEVLQRRLEITVKEIGLDALETDVLEVDDATLEAEMAQDREQFDAEIDSAVHARSVRLGLGLRRYLEKGAFSAFSMNFLAFDRAEGPVSTVPFLECCKAMARGIGYAGEGDVLTASLVGALAAGFGDTSFTEMFCPDWAGNTVFLSHMGEFNPAIAAGKPRLYEKDYPFTAAQNPAALACAPQPGPATLVNLSPGPDETFRLIITPVELLNDGTHPDLVQWVRGWFRPPLPTAAFLETYSRLGGTHHCAITLGHHVEGMLAFARMAGMEGCVIA